MCCLESPAPDRQCQLTGQFEVAAEMLQPASRRQPPPVVLPVGAHR